MTKANFFVAGGVRRKQGEGKSIEISLCHLRLKVPWNLK
jgi:hypothetical protein